MRTRYLVAVLVLGALCAGAFFGGRASVSRVAAPAGRTTTVRPANTAIDVFAPWTEGGTLASGIEITGHLTGGSCWTSSIADGADNDAWRCMSPGVFQGESVSLIHDPCFAPPDESNVTEVACAESPWSGIELLKLTKPLSFSASGTPSAGASVPWFMEISNGDRCGLTTGTTGEAGGVTLAYGCRLGNASTPDTTTEPWTVEYLPNDSHVLVSVDVVTAWR